MSQSAVQLGTTISPSEVTTGSFSISGGGTMSYYKIGKLYFGFAAAEASGQYSPVVGGANSTEYNASVAAICAALGITLAAAYQSVVSATSTFGSIALWYYSGGSWTNGAFSTVYAIGGIIST